MKTNPKLIVLLALTPLVGQIIPAVKEEEPLNAAGLRAMITGLAYEVKDLNTEAGKEKYEFTVKTTNFNIPIGAEISPSKNYIWLTANLGKSSEKTKWQELVRANSVTQPTMFYVTKSDVLMVAIPVENHGVTPVWLKKCIDKIATDVDSQSSVWNTGG
ncbi:MAG: hypothetical protein KDC26_03575 [Armatimonadetes bacterium]|nr:hypothetical protein [Armatimonadota bacterium]